LERRRSNEAISFRGQNLKLALTEACLGGVWVKMAAALLGRLDELHTRVDGGMPLHDVDLAIVSEAEAAVRSGQYGEELRVKFTKVALDTANQLSRLNMLADALSTYNLLVPHFSDAGVLFNVGMVHIKLGDLSEAYECFVEATNKGE
jgi:hypothetical protein